MVKVEIIKDSINPFDCRLTTFILEYPRFAHSELMTHRCFSKNSASSRAIPSEKVIQQIKDNPALPIWWGKNQSGMSAREGLTNNETFNSFDIYNGMGKLDVAKKVWLEMRDLVIEKIEILNKVGLHKQLSNRPLETWFNMRIILSGTDFENFFALRSHPDAQPEFEELATVMLEKYNESEPESLLPLQYHIPFGDKIEVNRIKDIFDKLNPEWDCQFYHNRQQVYDEKIEEYKIKIAIARCARISYFNYEGKDDYEADIKLCERLFGNNPKHLSPTEHVAQCQNDSNYYGNFRGWKQYRKFFQDENLTDSRVIKKKYKR